MGAGAELALALPCHFSGRLQHLPCPGEKVGQGNHPGLGLLLHPGLYDAQAHCADLLDALKQGVGTEGVVHELRVALRVHRHALPVLEVDDVQDAVADQQAVAGAEAAGHPLAHVHFLLDEHLGLVDVKPPLKVHKVHVLVGGFAHLRWDFVLIIADVTARHVQRPSVQQCPALEIRPQPALTHLMGSGALFGVLAGLLGQVLGGPGAGGAGDPPGRAGGTQQGVFNWRHLRPPRLSA